MPDKLNNGILTRRKVLGDKHVDKALEQTTSFDEPFQNLITESAWGTVWKNEAISLRERSMITLALPLSLKTDPTAQPTFNIKSAVIGALPTSPLIPSVPKKLLKTTTP